MLNAKNQIQEKSAKSLVLLIQDCLFIFVSVCMCHGAHLEVSTQCCVELGLFLDLKTDLELSAPQDTEP